MLYYLLFAGVAGMLLLAVAIILFFVVYQRRLSRQEDQLRKAELDYQKGLLNASIITQEKERERIAQDLHDSVGATLSTTKLYVHRLGGSSDPEFQQLKSEASQLLDDTIRNIRNTTRNLLPVNLEKFGLVAAVSDLCQKYKTVGVPDISFSYNGDIRFAPDRELAVYRIVQELMSNTLRHADASAILIELSLNGQEGQLSYCDNGIGFTKPDQESANTGVGMKSLVSRAAYLDGRLDWHSSPGNGFQLSLHFPLSTTPPS